MNKVGVVAPLDDVHAKSVCYLAGKSGSPIFHICSDAQNLFSSSGWFAAAAPLPARLTDSTGQAHYINEFKTLWWRRPYTPQIVADAARSHDERTLINSAARLHLEGLVRAAFKGLCVNDPAAAQLAEHKIVQVQAAQSVGMPVPPTLFTNDYAHLLEFFEAMDEDVVVKSHFNSADLQIKTTRLTRELIKNEASIRVAPSIYQKFVRGEEHFRVVALRDRYQAVRFISTEVDSRIDLSQKARPYILESDVQRKISALLHELGLQFGVVDLKRDTSGTFYFLEVNQQGQFAFLDAVAGTTCMAMFTEFLLLT
jgi:hypothetical protein